MRVTAEAKERKAGLAVLTAGVAIFLGALGSAVVDWLWVLVLLGFLALVYGVAGIHSYQAPADGFAGRWGARLVRFGGAVLVLLGIVFLIWDAVGDPPDEGPGFVDVAWVLGFVALAIGVVLFAIGVIKAGVLPRASGVLMLVGFLAAVVIDMVTGAFFEDEPTTTAWGAYIGIPIFALGLALAGYTVWKGQRSRTLTDA